MHVRANFAAGKVQLLIKIQGASDTYNAKQTNFETFSLAFQKGFFAITPLVQCFQLAATDSCRWSLVASAFAPYNYIKSTYAKVSFVFGKVNCQIFQLLRSTSFLVYKSGREKSFTKPKQSELLRSDRKRQTYLFTSKLSENAATHRERERKRKTNCFHTVTKRKPEGNSVNLKADDSTSTFTGDAIGPR